MELSPEGPASAEHPKDDGAALPAGSGDSGVSDFVSALSEDNRAVAEAKGWTGADKINDIFDSYRWAESRLGKTLSPPGEEASAEDRAAFFERAAQVWTPEGPEGYAYAKPENLPEGFNYDEGFASEASKIFHDLKLTPEQAQGLHDFWVGQSINAHTMGSEAQSQAAEAQAKAIADANRQLSGKWGDPGTEAFDTNLSKAGKAIENMGLKEPFLKAGLLVEKADGKLGVTDAGVIEHMAAVFDARFSEDTLGAGAGSTPNPFTADNFNLSEQTKLVRNDPERAAHLIKSAGKDPAKYGLQ